MANSTSRWAARWPSASATLPADLDRIPAEAIDSFAGVGYYFHLADLKEGETVVDLGSGSGMDSFIAALKVGPRGKVFGIDMTDEQRAKAERLRDRDGFKNVKYLKGYIEEVPLPDGTADAVISNGVINLATDKTKVFREAARLLKSGGRLALSDIVTEVQLPETIVCNSTLWAACIGGAAQQDNYRAQIEEAGLRVVKEEDNPQYQFISENAQGASKKFGVKSVSLLGGLWRPRGTQRVSGPPICGEDCQPAACDSLVGTPRFAMTEDSDRAFLPSRGRAVDGSALRYGAAPDPQPDQCRGPGFGGGHQGMGELPSSGRPPGIPETGCSRYSYKYLPSSRIGAVPPRETSETVLDADWRRNILTVRKAASAVSAVVEQSRAGVDSIRCCERKIWSTRWICLAEEYRTVLLVEINGHSYAEAAEILGIRLEPCDHA